MYKTLGIIAGPDEQWAKYSPQTPVFELRFILKIDLVTNFRIVQVPIKSEILGFFKKAKDQVWQTLLAVAHPHPH